MKKTFTSSNYNLYTLFTFILIATLILSCNKTITKEDVESQANDAKKELQKARDEVKKAFEVKHDYMRQEHQKLVDHMEARSSDLNKELDRLTNVAEQSGELAISDVNSAISKVTQEKTRLDQQLVELKNTKIVEWDDVSRNVNESIASIESSIDQMVDDLKRLDVLIQQHGDTTSVNAN